MQTSKPDPWVRTILPDILKNKLIQSWILLKRWLARNPLLNPTFKWRVSFRYFRFRRTDNLKQNRITNSKDMQVQTYSCMHHVCKKKQISCKGYVVIKNEHVFLEFLQIWRGIRMQITLYLIKWRLNESLLYRKKIRRNCCVGKCLSGKTETSLKLNQTYQVTVGQSTTLI